MPALRIVVGLSCYGRKFFTDGRGTITELNKNHSVLINRYLVESTTSIIIVIIIYYRCHYNTNDTISFS